MHESLQESARVSVLMGKAVKLVGSLSQGLLEFECKATTVEGSTAHTSVDLPEIPNSINYPENDKRVFNLTSVQNPSRRLTVNTCPKTHTYT